MIFVVYYGYYLYFHIRVLYLQYYNLIIYMTLQLDSEPIFKSRNPLNSYNTMFILIIKFCSQYIHTRYWSSKTSSADRKTLQVHSNSRYRL